MRKFVSEYMLPVKARTLGEVLAPQPAASAVVAELLKWIDRADAASQTGGPRPVFAKENGDAIFPQEVLWWLTDVSRRKKERDAGDNDRGDEDGPLESDDVQEDDREEMDESDSSDCELKPWLHDNPAREPKILWALSKSEEALPPRKRSRQDKGEEALLLKSERS